MPVQVTFTYDESTRKWVATVYGVPDATEARQAFSAVVLTCQQLDPTLLVKAQVSYKEQCVSDEVGIERIYSITPAVRR